MKKVKVIINVIVFALLAAFAVLALETFVMLGEGERVSLPLGSPSPIASPK